ncbi:MAG: hypothetical protein JST59_18615 [Actinobacteria bacterium]|nr:hypothetical protein [Actinomycetota bacterium]
MYYGLLARFSGIVEALSGRLLRREIVVPAVVLSVVALLLVGVLWWISAIGSIALFFLLVLWLSRNHLRRTNGPGAGQP